MFDRARVYGKKVEAKDDVAVSVDDESVDVEAEEKKAEDKAAAFRRRLAGISMEDCFRPVPLPTKGSSDSAEESGRGGGYGSRGGGGQKISALTELLTLSAPNTTQLTIYLPAGTTMSLYAADSSNFEEIKMLILRVHEQQKLQPPLYYYAADFYEVRMHEGDGEPDMDMPALGRTKTLAQYKVDNEYCLCEVEGKGIPPPPPRSSPTLGSTSSSFFPPNMSVLLPPVAPSYSASPALGGGFMPATRKSPRGSAPPVAYDPDAAARETAAAQRIPESSASSLNSSCFSTASSDYRFAAGRNFDRTNSMVETIQIIVGYVHETIEVHPNMTLRDLLPEINKKNRLRIFSDEFAFALSEEDQARLKIMSPITDLRVTVQSLGVRVLELQKRVYVDTNNVKVGSKPPLPSPITLTNANVANIPIQTNKEKEKKISAPEERIPRGIADLPSHTLVVTNQTAPMYEEWLVVKKNKYGLRQERIFGVDATKGYNMKRGHTRANPDVQRAEREIHAIRKVDILDDRKTFRISWNDERDIYDIDYTCANNVECGELVAKLLFLKDEAAKKRKAGTSAMFPGRR